MGPSALPICFGQVVSIDRSVLVVRNSNVGGVIGQAGIDSSVLGGVPTDRAVDTTNVCEDVVGSARVSTLQVGVSRISPSLAIAITGLTSTERGVLRRCGVGDVVVYVITVMLYSMLDPLLVEAKLQRVGGLDNMARTLGCGSDQRPIRIDTLPERLGPLKRTLGGVRRTLIGSFRHLDRFTSSLTRRLEAPVGTLLNRGRIALDRAEDVTRCRGAVTNGVRRLRGVSQLARGVLFLTETSGGGILIGLSSLSLGGRIRGLLSCLRCLSSRGRVYFGIRYGRRVFTSGVLLRQVLSGLVIGTVECSPRGSHVRVADFLSAGKSLGVSVTDPKAGVGRPRGLFHEF